MTSIPLLDPETGAPPLCHDLGPQMCFHTKRFYVRALRPEDATERYVSWFNNEDLQHTMGKHVRNWGRDQAAQHIAKFDNFHTCHVGFFPRGETLPVGFGTVEFKRNNICHTVMVIGEPEYRSMGVAFEYALGTLDWTFYDMGFNKAVTLANSRNLPAIFACEKLGMTLEGRLREHLRERDGSRSDELHYTILKSEWPDIKKRGEELENE